MINWIKQLPTIPLAVIALLLALVPFQPEPHLWEKLKMLATGELSKPIDIFDLFLHGTPLCLFIIRLLLRSEGKK